MSVSLGLIVFALSFLLIFIIDKVFFNKNIVDQINNRSSHSAVATRSGGIAIFITIFILSFVNYLAGSTLFDYSILIPLGLLVAIGLYDDVYNIDFKLKFIFQIIAAKIIIDTGLLIDNFHGLFGIFEINRAVAQLLTIFIILSIINAINFIDGIDGLAISIFSIFIISFEFFSIELNQLSNFSIISILAIIPMYYFNLKKNRKVFLGDSGSHLLGGIISIYVVFILSQNYLINPKYDLHKIIFVFSILSYPVIDIIRIVLLRLSKNQSPFKADKEHIHHIILKKTNNHLITTLIIISFSLILMIITQFF